MESFQFYYLPVCLHVPPPSAMSLRNLMLQSFISAATYGPDISVGGGMDAKFSVIFSQFRAKTF